VDKINTESSLALHRNSQVSGLGSHRRLCREGKVVLTMSEEVGTNDVGGIVTGGTSVDSWSSHDMPEIAS
jgi:hypothetical protein